MSKWSEFTSDTYRIVDLGRPAVFLIPAVKLDFEMGAGNVRDALKKFLMENFGAFTTTLLPQFGVWMDDGEHIHYDECCRYEVSFVGKERIPLLLEFLARVALATDEICLYFSAGQYTCLLYPNTPSS